MLVIVGTRSAEHSLRSQVGIGSESHCLLGQLSKILEISDSEASLKVEKSGGVFGEEGECGDKKTNRKQPHCHIADISSCHTADSSSCHTVLMTGHND